MVLSDYLLLIFHLDMASKSNSKRLRWMTSVCGRTFMQFRFTASTCKQHAMSSMMLTHETV